MDFMERLNLVVLTTVFGLTLQGESTFADENPPMDSAKPVEPKIKEIRVEKVRALSEPPLSNSANRSIHGENGADPM